MLSVNTLSKTTNTHKKGRKEEKDFWILVNILKSQMIKTHILNSLKMSGAQGINYLLKQSLPPSPFPAGFLVNKHGPYLSKTTIIKIDIIPSRRLQYLHFLCQWYYWAVVILGGNFLFWHHLCYFLERKTHQITSLKFTIFLL